MKDILMEFLTDVALSDFVVGHNVNFDKYMIITELIRLAEDDPLRIFGLELLLHEKNILCTMLETRQMCKLKTLCKSLDKTTGIEKSSYRDKNPKLSEAYFHFFGYNANTLALHNAIIDVVLCLRIFMKYKFDCDICGECTNITSLIMEISPEGYIPPCKLLVSM